MYNKTSAAFDAFGSSANEPEHLSHDNNSARLVSSSVQHCPHQARGDSMPGGCDDAASDLHMAFLHVMTQKVMEATAKQPSVLKQLNASIRRDRT